MLITYGYHIYFSGCVKSIRHESLVSKVYQLRGATLYTLVSQLGAYIL